MKRGGGEGFVAINALPKLGDLAFDLARVNTCAISLGERADRLPRTVDMANIQLQAYVPHVCAVLTALLEQRCFCRFLMQCQSCFSGFVSTFRLSRK